MYQQIHWSYLESVSTCNFRSPLTFMLPHVSAGVQLLPQLLKACIYVYILTSVHVDTEIKFHNLPVLCPS